MNPGPLSAVLHACQAGAQSTADIAATTGLSRDLVGTALDRLVAMGRISRQELSPVCAPGGCGACPSSEATGSCAAGETSGPVLLALSTRP